MSTAIRLSARLIYASPTRKYLVMQPMILQNSLKFSDMANKNYSISSKTNLLNKNFIPLGEIKPVMNYSTNTLLPEDEEEIQEYVQYHTNNLLNQSNNHQQQQWREYSSSNKMNEKGSGKAKLVVNPITKNLTYISSHPRKLEFDKKTLRLQNAVDSPLCIMFGYMMAKKKHLLKYSKIYADLGFDVLLIELNPWQLLWPTKGSQLIAADAINFLYNNQDKFSPMIIHGFSVGGYQWGEAMVQMSRDLPKYQPLLDKITAQVWDSAADISEIPVGLPKSIFPKNKTLESALRNYAIYHLKAFYQIATVHYARSSNIFHFPILKCPALFLVSEKDPIGSVKSNMSVKEDMESIGIKTTWQSWPDTMHVMHYMKHPEQYLDLIVKHLRENNVLEDVARKTGIAKL